MLKVQSKYWCENFPLENVCIIIIHSSTNETRYGSSLVSCLNPEEHFWFPFSRELSYKKYILESGVAFPFLHFNNDGEVVVVYPTNIERN